MSRIAGLLFGMAGLFATGQALSADAALIEAATKEGEVVWYSGFIYERGVLPIAQAFEKKYPGIKVQAARHQDNETILLVQTEARAGTPVGDVIDGFEAPARLVEAGLIQPYKAEAAEAYPPESKDADGNWTSLILYIQGLAYNTELVKHPPKSYQDLLDPAYKGHIAWPDAELLAAGPGFIYTAEKELGDEKAREFLAELAKQDIANIPASQRVVLDNVISGEYWLGLQTYNHHVALSAAQGAPIAWSGDFGVLQTAGSVSMIKNAPHPNAAKLLIEFMLSDEGQQIFRDNNYIPASPKVDALDPKLKPAAGGFKPVVATGDNVIKDLPGLVETYREYFR